MFHDVNVTDHDNLRIRTYVIYLTVFICQRCCFPYMYRYVKEINNKIIVLYLLVLSGVIHHSVLCNSMIKM